MLPWTAAPCQLKPPNSAVLGVYDGEANFGFNFTCEVETAKKRTVIKGQITYHDDRHQFR